MSAPANPFRSAEAREHTNYCSHDGVRLVRPYGEDEPSPFTTFVHDSFVALGLHPLFPCVGAKSALRQRSYRFGLYEALGRGPSIEGLAHDLYTFVHDDQDIEGEFTTFVASFAGPVIGDEESFETLLWATLQQLHDLDAPHHPWDATVSADTADPRFSFSFAETAFFVIGLHAASSRVTRRLAWPTLVFNPHRQFESLKEDGRYERFQQVIRDGERQLQGTINPMLSDFGGRSEAAQYSGRQVGEQWRCPFHSASSNPPRGRRP